MIIRLAFDEVPREEGAVVCFIPIALLGVWHFPTYDSLLDTGLKIESLDIDDDLDLEQYVLLMGNTMSYLEEAGNTIEAGIPVIYWQESFRVYTKKVKVVYDDGFIDEDEYLLAFNAKVSEDGEIVYEKHQILEWTEDDLANF